MSWTDCPDDLTDEMETDECARCGHEVAHYLLVEQRGFCRPCLYELEKIIRSEDPESHQWYRGLPPHPDDIPF